MRKVLIIAIALGLVGGGTWFVLRNRDEEQKEPTAYQTKDYPERPGDAEGTASLIDFQSALTDLMFKYPTNWNVTEGEENTEASQLLTVESPLDINEFYFCLDINAVGSNEANDFAISDAKVEAVDTLESGHKSVIFSVQGLKGLHWGVTDETPQIGAEAFTSEIANEAGDRLQVFGRFNCREENKPDLTAEEFQKARWFQEAKAIINSLTF